MLQYDTTQTRSQPFKGRPTEHLAHVQWVWLKLKILRMFLARGDMALKHSTTLLGTVRLPTQKKISR
jgi:hypothetical protein